MDHALLQILVDVHMVVSVVPVSSSFLELSWPLLLPVDLISLAETSAQSRAVLYSHKEIKSYLGGLLAHSGAAAVPYDQHLGLS